ncbi:cellular nucleic acid-binding protein-like [Zingiber officinale]|uniref:cellular nucleic acid-binding protein-like n=1 Tax=Zingiber officinale TaxID=94328 RepID=UPI001C4B9AF2|nr:cellular nucleic acid-binding protein-like [Zingiber officinale]
MEKDKRTYWRKITDEEQRVRSNGDEDENEGYNKMKEEIKGLKILGEASWSQLPPGDLRLCNNCYKQGHLAADCTNEKACNNCRKTGHLARDCINELVCNLCNVAGHVARQCPKSGTLGTFGGGFGACGFGGWVAPTMICHNCGGRGHMAYECPSSRFMDRGFRRY